MDDDDDDDYDDDYDIDWLAFRLSTMTVEEKRRFKKTKTRLLKEKVKDMDYEELRREEIRETTKLADSLNRIRTLKAITGEEPNILSVEDKPSSSTDTQRDESADASPGANSQSFNSNSAFGTHSRPSRNATSEGHQASNERFQHMNVKVLGFGKDELEFTILPSTKVYLLKQFIHKRIKGSFTASQIILHFDNAPLEDNCPLSKYEITDGSVINYSSKL